MNDLTAEELAEIEAMVREMFQPLVDRVAQLEETVAGIHANIAINGARYGK